MAIPPMNAPRTAPTAVDVAPTEMRRILVQMTSKIREAVPLRKNAARRRKRNTAYHSTAEVPGVKK
jgi:hypothetical protein